MGGPGSGRRPGGKSGRPKNPRIGLRKGSIGWRRSKGMSYKRAGKKRVKFLEKKSRSESRRGVR
jgi:hypothetical protein